MIEKRIFFPIGQGAFYAEIHENFSMVYDCGVGRSFSIPLHAQNVITHAAKHELKGDVILFISHFDTDHISGIDFLKTELNNNGKKIAYVIMPLLYDAQKAITIALLNQQGIWNTDIIQDPSNFFGENTKVIYVNPTEEARNDQDPIDITRSTPPAILNGSTLTYSNNDWIFIPYNYDYFPRKTYVENMISGNSINLQQFKTDPVYALKEINNNPGLFQSIYNHPINPAKYRYGSYINENSLFLYSGPSPKMQFLHPIHLPATHTHNTCNISIHHHHYYCYCRSGCIYTGDGNLNLVNLATTYSKHLPYVGTVQIPHHGSAGNFNISFFQNKSYTCPMSVGCHYKKFPAYSVLYQLATTNCRAFIANEQSALVQIFR